MNRVSGSEDTVLIYVKGVKYFLEFLGLEDPETALEKVGSGEVDLEKSLNSYIDGLLAQGLSRNTVQTKLKGLKKWLDLNGIDFDWDKVERPKVWTVVEDRAPTKEELRKLMELGNLRDRFIISFLVSSGVRIGTLIKLRVGDVDLEYDLEIGRVKIPAEHSKLRRSYYTFIPLRQKNS
jgi:integrase